MENNTLRNHSKKDWNSDINIEAVTAGSLQRIADATESMAVNHIQLLAELERYKRWEKEARERNEKYVKTISALRGVITKLKNQTTIK
jgi:hypothetical protein